LNGNKKIEAAAEGILVTESLDAYDFVITAMLEMAHKRICGDGIFQGGVLFQSLGIDDIRSFVANQYHLLQRDWPDYFNGACFPSKGYSRTIFTLLPMQRFNPTMASYGKSWVIELIG
jgi:hypothetical protein